MPEDNISAESVDSIKTDIRYLIECFKIKRNNQKFHKYWDECFEEQFYSQYLYWLLKDIDKRIENYHNPNEAKLRDILISLRYTKKVASVSSDGFILEARVIVPYINEDRYPNLMAFISLKTGGGLDKENHGASMGYHIHFLTERKKRTNVIFLFDPREIDVSDTLFWEYHNESKGIHIIPDDFSRKKKSDIYDVSCTLLKKIGKTNFKRKSDKAKEFYVN